MELISGIESELSARSIALTIQLVDESQLEAELELYRRWGSERRVDGVFVVDLRVDDPRPAELVRLGLPAVVLAGSRGQHALPTIWQNEADAIAEGERDFAMHIKPHVQCDLEGTKVEVRAVPGYGLGRPPSTLSEK